MDGYDATTYGSGFADVYDAWYHGITDIEATTATLLDLASGGPVLELAVGTGRLAIPLAEAGADTGVTVTGVDASAEMLALLAARDPHRRVRAIEGDMVTDLPDGPFTLAFVAYNSLFNLTSAEQQHACFGAVAARLSPGGHFVVEAFVPEQPFRDGDTVEVRTLAADRVVLSVTRNDATAQSAIGQFVDIVGRPGEPADVRLRPWAIHYATPEQLDAYAAATGFALAHRWEDFTRQPFRSDSPRHVSVYRRI